MIGGFREVTGGRELGHSLSPAPALGAGVPTKAVTHLPRQYQLKELCHQLYPGAEYCVMLMLLVLATDSAQVGQTIAKTDRSKQAKSFLMVFPLLFFFGRTMYPTADSWLLGWFTVGPWIPIQSTISPT